MTLYENLKSEIILATKERNETRKNALKSILSASQQFGDFSDKSIQSCASKLRKQLKESLEYFSEKSTLDSLNSELLVIEDYCPKTASDKEILDFVESHREELNVLSDGARVGYVVKNIGKAVDGNSVKTLLRLILV